MKKQRMQPTTISGNFTSDICPVSTLGALSTGQFVDRQTLGNVAVCISGGGSRSLCAGIGQLQALESVQVNGASLLGQVRALGTVSGGGWIGIPFTYLPGKTTDAAYLGEYITPGNLTLSALESLQPSNIGAQVANGFSVAHLALEALYLYNEENVPSDMLWQTLIGIHILQPYGLFKTGENYTPASLFSYDSAALAEYVTGLNPDLGQEPANLIAEVTGQQRPYLIGNCAIFVTTSSGQTLLAPVQSTPFVTGVMSTPPGAFDANSRQVGGGGVTSFAFNSTPETASASSVEIVQSRQWSLADVTGTSSAAFAAVLKEEFRAFSTSPAYLAAAVRIHRPRVVAKLARAGSDGVKVDTYLQSLASAADRGDRVSIKFQTDILTSLIPAYQYWPVQNIPAGETVNVTEFADGGLLDNSGVASMLAYSDIQSIIAFINSETKLSMDSNNVIIVDDGIPPLFGYQPYDANTGYVAYAGAPSPGSPLFQNNQVFSSADFQPLLDGLWEASGSGGDQTAPLLSQVLTTVQNDWFGVAPGKTVKMLWVYLGIASDWYNSFTDVAVRAAMDAEILLDGFPHYRTLKTELNPVQVNLLANLTAWTVAASENAGKFTSLFSASAAAKAGS